MRVAAALLGLALTVGCGSTPELPIPPDPYRYTRELTPEDLSVFRALMRQFVARPHRFPIYVANRTMRVCDATDLDYLCASPYDLDLLRTMPSGRIARGVYERNRISMMIPTNLGVDVEIISPIPQDLPGLLSPRAPDRPLLVFLTAPVYTPDGQAIVFTKQMMVYGGWMILERRGGEDWSIEESTRIPLS